MIGLLMNNELFNILKEAVLAESMVMSVHVSGGVEEAHGKPQ
jgi:hypothetical protein